MFEHCSEFARAPENIWSLGGLGCHVFFLLFSKLPNGNILSSCRLTRAHFLRYLKQTSWMSGVRPLVRYLGDSGDEVTQTITKALSTVAAAWVATWDSLFTSFRGYQAWELTPLTDPAIRAEEHRRPLQQVRTVLTGGSCVQEITRLSCIAAEWLQMGSRSKWCESGCTCEWLCEGRRWF